MVEVSVTVNVTENKSPFRSAWLPSLEYVNSALLGRAPNPYTRRQSTVKARHRRDTVVPCSAPRPSLSLDNSDAIVTQHVGEAVT